MESSLCIICDLKADNSIISDLPMCKPCFDSQNIISSNLENQRTIFFPEINQITEQLFLGNRDASYDSSILDKHGIQTIFIAGEELKESFPGKYKYYKYDIKDSEKENCISYFKTFCITCDEENKKENNVFIHCSAGVSRSSSLVISYIIYSMKKSFEEAYDWVKSKRPCIKPNKSFIKQLKVFEKESLSESDSKNKEV
mmetsp:Transcript_37500/g.38926  ORF Transcript_37500/g.38926 Transcript_37500/m.38926 type:complete len:199 (+) Transcript_37500:1-597(+)